MTAQLLAKLAAILLTVALGYAAGRAGWLGGRAHKAAAARVLSDAAFMLFVPALLFRTMAQLDVGRLPWGLLAAYYLPAAALLLALYALARSRRAWVAGAGAAAPATLAVTALYGNGVQLGIPMAAALLGPQGLALHLALVALHGVLLLTLVTVLAELDEARARPGASVAATAATTARRALVHPVTLPVLAGLAWNRTGLGLHPVVDESLAVLGTAVVPLCLVLIGLTLAEYGVRGLRGSLGSVLALCLLKLLLLPALVLAVAHGVFGLSGLPLQAAVLMAALPTGTNALIVAHRYGVLQAQATAAIVLSTLAFAGTVTLWLLVLGRVG